MGIVPDNPKTNDDDQKVFVLAVLASLRWQERPSGRAAVLMTACEKTLVDDIEDVGSGQVDYSPVPVFTARKTGPGFSVIRSTDSRLLSSAISA